MIFDLSEGMKNCKKSGKSQGISRWMISGNTAFRSNPKFSTDATIKVHLLKLDLKKNVREKFGNQKLSVSGKPVVMSVSL